MAKSTLEQIIAPISLETFFDEYYEKNYLYVKGDSPNKFDSFLKESEIDDILTGQILTFPNTRMVKKDEELPSKEYTIEGSSVIDMSKVTKLFHDGASLVLSYLHDRHLPLKNLCDYLAQDFGQKVQTNIYCTPGGNSQGFIIHHDNHDVFVLQIAGSKKWHIYDSPIELVNRDIDFNKEVHFPGDEIEELTLNPGDFLYIPRGIMHAAETTETKSIHITTGLIGYTWQDLLIQRIKSMSFDHVELRRGLKTQYWENTDDPYYTETFKQIMSLLADEKNIEEALKESHEIHLNRFRPSFNNPIAQAEKVDQISLESMVRLYPNISVATPIEDDNFVIKLFNKEIELDPALKPIVDEMIEMKEFRVKDISDDMDDESKLEFAQSMALEGLLEIVKV